MTVAGFVWFTWFALNALFMVWVTISIDKDFANHHMHNWEQYRQEGKHSLFDEVES